MGLIYICPNCGWASNRMSEVRQHEKTCEFKELTADNARKFSDKNATDRLEEARKLIRVASRMGKVSQIVEVSAAQEEAFASELREAGFTVTSVGEFGGTLLVSWDRNNKEEDK